MAEPAFPVPYDALDDGMTLRDWFAGQALAGLSGAFARVDARMGETQAEADARWAYSRADAMLAARSLSPDRGNGE